MLQLKMNIFTSFRWNPWYTVHLLYLSDFCTLWLTLSKFTLFWFVRNKDDRRIISVGIFQHLGGHSRGLMLNRSSFWTGFTIMKIEYLQRMPRPDFAHLTIAYPPIQFFNWPKTYCAACGHNDLILEQTFSKKKEKTHILSVHSIKLWYLEKGESLLFSIVSVMYYCA